LDTLHDGTGASRAWISVAGAVRRSATVLDYIRVRHAKASLAFAYWPVAEVA
jgi:hypothetical protein